MAILTTEQRQKAFEVFDNAMQMSNKEAHEIFFKKCNADVSLLNVYLWQTYSEINGVYGRCGKHFLNELLRVGILDKGLLYCVGGVNK